MTFEDGLGERRYTIGADNRPLEILRLSPVLSAVSSFEFALRERAGRLASFRHPSYGQVRAVELEKLTSALVVVSDHVPGIRLLPLLAAAERRLIPLEIDATRCVIRQLVSAVAAWEEAVPDVCHGAIAPERIIITPEGRLVIVEYVLGSALEQLRYSRAQYWTQLRIALPETIGPLLFDSRVDITQIGAVALSLILGRPLSSDEYPEQIERLIDGAAVRMPTGALEPMSIDLREWLLRALQLDPERSFVSASDARADLDLALGSQDLGAELGALRAFVARSATRDSGDDAPTIFREAPAMEPNIRTRRAVGTERAHSTHEAAPSKVTGADGAVDIDLGPRIEALKTFLARYPSRRPVDEPPPKPQAKGSGAQAPAMPAPPAAAPPAPAPALPAPAMPASRVQGAVPPSPSSVFFDEGAPASYEGMTYEGMTYEEVAASRPLPSDVSHAPSHAQPEGWLGSRRRKLVAGISVAVALGVLAFAALPFIPTALDKKVGALSVDTNPAGISVLVDGTLRGVTPLRMDLPAGDHVVELVTETERRRIPVHITAGGQMSQFLELPRVVSELGELAVRTDAPRVSVIVDGRLVGRSPLTVPELTPGLHTVVLQHDAGTVTEQVLIESGRTASLVVSMAGASTANAAGWISISAPADVQVYEGDRFVGTNRSDRIMLPVGRHDLQIVNEALGYRASQSVQVSAGQVSPIRIQWPQGSLALNAIPWAEVWIDGQMVGETPIGSLSLPIGVHEVVFRHPELGERRSSVTVTVGKPTKVGVDLGAK